MRKATLTSLVGLLMLCMPISAFAVQTIDGAHRDLYANPAKESCDLCHFSDPELVCDNCHGASGQWTITNNPAPRVATHAGAAPTYNCEVCHNPHVSLQNSNSTGLFPTPPAKALVKGTISAPTPSVNPAEDGKDHMEFTLSSVKKYNSSTDLYEDFVRGTHGDADWADLTLWVPAASGDDSYSFKLVSSNSDGTYLKANGGLPWVCSTDKNEYETQAQCDATTPADVCAGTCAEVALGTSFELQYGRLIAARIDSSKTSYKLVASNSGAAVVLDGPDMFVNPTGNDGVCQVCHTGASGKTLKYWKSDGSGNTHNAGAKCTECHSHESGFMVTACNACHGQSSDSSKGHPVSLGELAGSTSSTTAGAHAKHVDEYGFTCEMCHTGTGMTIGPPPTTIKDDGIQMGFQVNGFDGTCTSYKGQQAVEDTGFGYVGTNGTQITPVATGAAASTTCSNIYCHSNGRSVRMGCATAAMTSGDFYSPPWDGGVDPQGDNYTCNNCHGGDALHANPMNSGVHTNHITTYLGGIKCQVCHAGTTKDEDPVSGLNNNTILNDLTKHVNGVYDVDLGVYQAANGSTLAVDPGLNGYGGSILNPVDGLLYAGCTNLACHGGGKPWYQTDTAQGYACKDTIDCLDCTGGKCDNIPPVLVPESRTCYNITSNTYVLVDGAYDPDYIDPVKAAFNGVGNDGSTGLYQVKWFGNDGSIFETANITDVSNPQIVSAFSYSEDYLNSGAVRGDQVNTLYWVKDNSGASSAKAGWQLCDTIAYDETVNSLPVIDQTGEATNSTTIRITNNSTDADYDTRPSNTNWTGYDKSTVECGHTGTAATITYKWFNDVVPKTKVNVVLTESPQALIQDHTYDAAALASTGNTAWYFVIIDDNTQLGACGVNGQVKSGWKGIVMP